MRHYIMKMANTAFIACLFTISALNASESEVSVPLANDLQKDSAQCVDKQLPILLMFSAEDCPYCVTVEEEFLKPMMISGDYTDKVLIRKVMLDVHPDAIGFDGGELNPASLASQYSVFATPTVVLVDDQGKEIAERLVGINTVDYYGAYLDQSIEQAKSEMIQKGQVQQASTSQAPFEKKL